MAKKSKTSFVKLADMAPLWLEHRKLPKKSPEAHVVVSLWCDLEQSVSPQGKPAFTAHTGPNKSGTWTVCMGGRVFGKLPARGISVAYVGKSEVLLMIPAETALAARMIHEGHKASAAPAQSIRKPKVVPVILPPQAPQASLH